MDWRNIREGQEIPTETYSDQPYVVKTADGAWLCIMTTGAGREGEPGQHVVTMRSLDRGQTWLDLTAVEPSDGPESSYAVLLATPAGRIFCFYNHNTDNTRQVRADMAVYPDGYCRRVDSQGHFVFKYSDDHGKSWSAKRYDIPMRLMDIDRKNPYEGEILFFWNVGKAFYHGSDAFVPLHKVGGFGHGFFTRSEGVLLKSSNLLSEPDPEKITWETLPNGDFGLTAPPGGGLIAEEQSFSVLSDGSFYCVYRTIDGHPACAYSRDGGHTWSQPKYQQYADGRLMKHPRAANFAWRCLNGKYLYWYHNHGGNWYEDRNPVWLACGREADGGQGKVIEWSEPEIVLYDDDPWIRMSYPDLIEEDGDLYLSETQKDKARVHRIDPDWLQRLLNQFECSCETTRSRILDLSDAEAPLPARIEMPQLPVFVIRDQEQPDYRSRHTRTGFCIELWLNLDDPCLPRVLADNRGADGKGFCLQTTPDGTIEILLNDGRTENRWASDRNLLQAQKTHHVVMTVDSGPCIITFVIDGILCDGGSQRQFGWGRFSPNLRDVNGEKILYLSVAPGVRIQTLRLYDTPLSTSEAIGNYRAGLKDESKQSESLRGC
jgi:hypothetical protein